MSEKTEYFARAAPSSSLRQRQEHAAAPPRLYRQLTLAIDPTCCSDTRKVFFIQKPTRNFNNLWRSKRRRIDDYVDQRQQLTIDGEGMCDAFKCLYWLAKNEIARTTVSSPALHGTNLFSVSPRQETKPMLQNRVCKKCLLQQAEVWK